LATSLGAKKMADGTLHWAKNWFYRVKSRGPRNHLNLQFLSRG
jgi:hypothetical protein